MAGDLLERLYEEIASTSEDELAFLAISRLSTKATISDTVFSNIRSALSASRRISTSVYPRSHLVKHRG